VIKPTIQRVRPCNQVDMQKTVVLRVHCGGGYSFTSSHATNHFALAVFLIFAIGRHFRRIAIPLLLWAASIAYGQVYVGVHFPLDILGGALLGTMIGGFIGILYRLLPPMEKVEREDTRPAY
jgi:membrane-associated phospholipid phosphatase